MIGTLSIFGGSMMRQVFKSIQISVLLFAWIAMTAPSCSSTKHVRSTESGKARPAPRGPSAETESEEVPERAAGKAGVFPGRIEEEMEMGEGEALHPPEAKAVARRALVLMALGQISLFPRPSERTPASSLEFFDSKREKLVTWLKRERIWDDATEGEKSILSAPVGTRAPERSESAEDPGEGLLVMLWALNHAKRIPDYDTPSPGISILSTAMPEAGAPTADFVDPAELRPAGEIEFAFQKSEIWNWRAQAKESVDKGRFPEGKELEQMARELDEKARAAGFQTGPIRDGLSFFQELIRFSAFFAAKSGFIPKPIRGDFPVLKKSYGEITEKEFRELRSIAARRHRAFLWLKGSLKSWDSPSPDS